MKLTNIAFSITLVALLLPLSALGQTERGPMGFPDLIMADIPGAPQLSEPMLITGTEEPVITEGMGLAAPAYYDWDGDGLKDLLIGEFGTGVENGRYVGNFVRVYKNTGTEEQPEFTGGWNYAYPPFAFEAQANGTPYSVDQFCCIGFTPQFVDLDNDGMPDMITGSYYGEVYWFRASEEGFMPGEFLPQQFPEVGGPRDVPDTKLPRKEHQFYWLYSSASFGDITGDGKPDLITGGRALRISKNIGSEAEPQFSQRELLLDREGEPLKVHKFTKEELKFYEVRAILGYKPPVGGDSKLSPYVVDWDGDGMLDLLVTNSHSHTGLAAIDFFKGVQTKEGYRFHPAVPLFTAKDGAKAFPGSSPYISVTDWNGDGVNDLLVGTIVMTVQGELNDQLSWNWQKDEGLIKVSPAYTVQSLSESEIQRYREQKEAEIPKGMTWEEYITIRNQGYVYVMLGQPATKQSMK